MNVSRAEEMRAADRAVIEQYGIAEALLMENAGLAAYRALCAMMPVAGRCFAVVCGAGNNGADGLVVARHILSGGGLPVTYLMSDPEKFSGVGSLNFEIVTKLGVEIVRVESVDQVADGLAMCDGIVDGMLGTGISRPVEGLYAAVIEVINDSDLPVLSLDIPSGINGNTGQVEGVAVHASHTVTFGLPKIGNLLYPGYAHGGKLFVSHISFPPVVYGAEHFSIAVNESVVLPARRGDGHKGDFGDVLFIAGASTYFGAPYFSALSFMKAGGGYSRLAAPGSMIGTVAAKGSEIVYVPQKETGEGSIALGNKAALLALSEKVDFVVMGPGLSLAVETQQLVRELCVEIEKPLLLDGDGITAVCSDLAVVRGRSAPTIFTPHLGEMARLTDRPVGEIDADKVGVLQETARDLNAIIVLKGAHSLIGYPNGQIFINLSGNAGMATAGSGDVLTGTIAAMVGLGLSVEEAVRQGVYLHGFAGDLAAESLGQDGMMAQDILEHLPVAVKQHRVEPAETWSGRYAIPLIV